MSQSGIAEETDERTPLPTGVAEAPEAPAPAGRQPEPGGSRELLTLALPLVVSQSFMTVQVFLDTILLAWHDPREMAASFPAVMWYWLPFGLLQVTAGYVSTFVAQYTGAGRPATGGAGRLAGDPFRRRSPGLLFLLMVPAAPALIALGGHTPALQVLEVVVPALPGVRRPADAGHGRDQRVLLRPRPDLDRAGDRGRRDRRERRPGAGPDLRPAGVPRAGDRRRRLGDGGRVVGVGPAGAGAVPPAEIPPGVPHPVRLAARAGSVRPADEVRRTGRGRRCSSTSWSSTSSSSSSAGSARPRPGATTLTVRLNMVAFLPMMGLGQAVAILVGQRLGADRPDLAERSAYTGLKWVFGYMCIGGRRVPALPQGARRPVRGEPRLRPGSRRSPRSSRRCWCAWPSTPWPTRSTSTFSFALRGAGDTRFVSLLTFALAWPIMVVPTFLVVRAGGNIYWAWGFATAYIIAMAVCFTLRFRSGRWKIDARDRGAAGGGRGHGAVGERLGQERAWLDSYPPAFFSRIRHAICWKQSRFLWPSSNRMHGVERKPVGRPIGPPRLEAIGDRPA